MPLLAYANDVDVARAVDLSAREEEHVDAALTGAVEQLAPAVGEEALPAAAQQRDLRLAVAARARQQRGRGRNGRGRADRRVAGAADQAGNDVGKQLLVAERVVTLKHVRSLDRHRRLECRRSGKLGAAPSPRLRGEGWGEGDSPN